MADAHGKSGTSKSEYASMSVQELEHRRDEEFTRQEEALDDIQRGVKGLKSHAVAINEEVVTQIAVISEIDTTVDKAQGELEKGEKDARLVNAKRASVCRLYGFIAILVVVEVAMSAAGIRFV